MPLKVVIVGAGLGGLAAAIVLTKAGHDVEVFEKSSFHNEVGAAIHLAPNATRVLTAWGFDLEKMDPVPCDHLSVWDYKGNFIATPAVTEKFQKKLGMTDAWLLVHRVDLHNALREKAAEGADGCKPKIHLACRVDSVDPTTGKVTLNNGASIHADLVIGADGVHSRTVQATTDEPQKKKSTGQNCFRFLVPMEQIRANPLASSLIDQIGLRSLNAFSSRERRLIIYPCRSGTLINCVMFHPEGDNSNIGESSWLDSGNQADLMAQVETFSPELQALCGLAEDLKLWSLASRDPPPRFFKGKLALIGDAAHPTLPHQGQGGAQAFEDAATLGTLLTTDTKPEQVAQRLKMYNDIRYKQAVSVLFMSRVGDEHRETVMDDLKRYIPDAELPDNMWEFAWNSFPVKQAEHALAREKSTANDICRTDSKF
ncbi:hypothetical protein B0J11DRAFT_595681 [Dendryphion nanum]|uniref:FAD-binding domain-containing protein n=1 Tax=Dendryphion nanum TaxID=256645 RepID=A0A9P9EAL9_9PLEO|nr:hypothetical protein B0J11DRAFT_595681 [Dendryphion nanum]